MHNNIFEIPNESKFYKRAQNNNTSYTKEFNLFYKKYRHDLISLDIDKLIEIYKETGIRINHYFYTKNNYNPLLLKRKPYLKISHNSLEHKNYVIYNKETSKKISELEDLIENSLDGYDIDINDAYFSEYLDSDLNIHTFVDEIGIDEHNLENDIDELVFIKQNNKKSYISSKPLKKDY